VTHENTQSRTQRPRHCRHSSRLLFHHPLAVPLYCNGCNGRSAQSHMAGTSGTSWQTQTQKRPCQHTKETLSAHKRDPVSTQKRPCQHTKETLSAHKRDHVSTQRVLHVCGKSRMCVFCFFCRWHRHEVAWACLSIQQVFCVCHKASFVCQLGLFCVFCRCHHHEAAWAAMPAAQVAFWSVNMSLFIFFTRSFYWHPRGRWNRRRRLSFCVLIGLFCMLQGHFTDSCVGSDGGGAGGVLVCLLVSFVCHRVSFVCQQGLFGVL